MKFSSYFIISQIAAFVIWNSHSATTSQRRPEFDELIGPNGESCTFFVHVMSILLGIKTCVEWKMLIHFLPLLPRHPLLTFLSLAAQPQWLPVLKDSSCMMGKGGWGGGKLLKPHNWRAADICLLSLSVPLLSDTRHCFLSSFHGLLFCLPASVLSHFRSGPTYTACFASASLSLPLFGTFLPLSRRLVGKPATWSWSNQTTQEIICMPTPFPRPLSWDDTQSASFIATALWWLLTYCC